MIEIKKSRTKNSIIKNYIFSVIYKVINIAMPLITAPYLSRTVGVEGIGTYAYYYAIAHYFYLIGKMGLNNYGTREIAVSKDDKDKINYTFSSIYFQQVLIGVLMMVIYLIFGLINLSKGEIIPLLLGFYTLGCLLDIDWLYLGLEKFDKIAIKNILVKVLTLIFIFLFVKTSNDLCLYTLIMSLGMLFGFITLWSGVRKYVHFRCVDLKDIFHHIKPNFILMFPVLAANIYRSLDKVMVGKISGMIELGYYENAEKFVYAISSFITAFDNVMMPRCTNLISKNQEDKCKIYIHKTMKFLFFIILLMGSVILGISKTTVLVVFGLDFGNSIILLRILIVTLIFMTWSDVIRCLWVIPHKRDKIFLVTLSTGAAIDFILNLILIPKHGAVGACISTVVAELSVPMMQFIYFHKDLNYFKILKSQFIFIFAGIATTLTLFTIEGYFTINVFNMLLLLVIGTIIYCLICIILHFVFKRKEIIDYINIFKKYILKKNGKKEYK